MTRNRKRSLIVLTVALVILMSSAMPAAVVADSAGNAETTAAIGRVHLNDSAYVEINRLSLLSDANGNVVTFTLSITNNGAKSLSLIDYWVRLLGKNGDPFTAKIMPQDKDKTRIAAGSTQELSYYAIVNEATSLHDLKFSLMKWDFSLDNFERMLGEITVPDDFTQVTPAGRAHTVKFSGSTMNLAVASFTLGKNEKNSLPNVTLKLKNVGNHSITVPAYRFAVRTPEGYTYPLTAKGVKDLVVNSQETKEITLTGTVPASVSTEGWQLVVTQYLADLSLNMPVACLELPHVMKQDGKGAGVEVEFTDENGMYTAKLNGMYRLPWEDQDILTADLSLANKGSDSLPIPDMTGYFLLDGTVKVDAKVITPAKVLGLANGSSVGLQMAAKVPYTYEFSKLKLVLQEKTSDQKTVDVLDFETPADMLKVPIIDPSSSFELTDSGYRSKFSIQSVKTYQGQSTDQYTAQVLIENQEKRFTSPVKLVASFRAAGGTVYPANVLDVKEKVGPGGKAQIIVTSVIPKGVDTSGMNLLLGEAVASDGKLVLGEASDSDDDSDADDASSSADMYVKPFAFWLPQEKKDVKTPLKGISLAPYTLSIDHFGTTLNEKELSLKFNYEIVKDASTRVSTEGRKIVFQINDNNGVRAIEWSADLSSFEPRSNETPETPQSKLKVGKHNGFKISLQNGDLLYKLSFLKSYDFNIYEEFQGHRRLVGTMKNDWFVNSD
ncbi:COG1470 family protein [Paenibacillus sedimenti]|uniref:Uncharacterized protein n=1 Tax=Paenibacillus sedimenti TaxID=2770274 RepID=A0A926KKY3_9BACL|nr:hypothetical protein [Paenibacillus sedimenti]MBD0378681.1 hypothetical protein [Paenibacillus sedimenti]